MKTWLNVSEAAEYAGVSRDTIYTACERHELRSRARQRTTRDSTEAGVDRRLAGTARARASRTARHRRARCDEREYRNDGRRDRGAVQAL